MSNFLNVSVLVLATMVLVLAGMVGYLYWQQNKLLRSVGALSTFVASQFTPTEPEPEPEPEPQAQAEPEAEAEAKPAESDDDRVSVELVETEVADVDDLQTKTAAELKELLTKRGIPFGKRDSKTVLLELLKASS
jgi:hypothetical protein